MLVPQALAYAVLAGMPPARGLYVAALAPLAAAPFASSPYLGTGPTAITSLLTFGALTALAVPSSAEYVALAALLALLVAGARIALGLLRMGPFAYLISQPVLIGFTTGAAVVITASQLPAVLDVPVDEANPFVAAVEALRRPSDWNSAAIGVSIAVAVIILGGRRIHRLFPSVLIAMIGSIAWSRLTGYDGDVVGSISGGLPAFTLDLPWASIGSLLIPAAVIAIVGFAEPASIARHYATLERTRWDPNRELISQGMANLAAGIGGGFPAGGSFTRSALVREAGARSRVAGGITGLVVLAFLPFMSVLEALPTAVLGASIILAVRRFIDPAPFLELRRFTRLQFRLALITLAATLLAAPHVERAVVVGVALAIAAHLWRELPVSISSWRDDTTLHLAPRGVLYFASAPLLQERLSELLDHDQTTERLVVHLDGLGRIDVTGALALRRLLEGAHAAGLTTAIENVPPQAAKIVRRVLNGQVDPT